jgi:PTH2 family peptidyl-tRNA hydrolase
MPPGREHYRGDSAKLRKHLITFAVFRGPGGWSDYARGMRAAKQVIVMRKDLNMRKGKMIAQGAHASLKVLLDRKREPVGEGAEAVTLALTPAMAAWLGGRFTKVCVYVTSEAELEAIFQRAGEAGLACAMIVDAGQTEFAGVPTRTCCAIGPDWAEDVDAVTGALPLL